jgi:hypothetical protein
MTTMSMIKATLKAAILTATVGLLPKVALADDSATDRVPDHQQAEEPDARNTVGSSFNNYSGVPDHQQAEEPRTDVNTSGAGHMTGVNIPDHDTAENGGHQTRD